VKSVLAIPVGRGRCRTGISDPESSEQLCEVVGAVRVHLNRFCNHPVEIDGFTRRDGAWGERERTPQTGLPGRGVIAEGVIEIKDDGRWSGIKWPRRHQI